MIHLFQPFKIMKKNVLMLGIFLILQVNVFAQLIHSHNDYEQKEPFFAAYNLGFDSIEADLYLKDGQLCVAHDEKDVSTERTLEKLYIEPLLAKIKQNGGYPYANKKSLHLLLDLKKNGRAIMEALETSLKPHKKQLTHVIISISGDMPPPSEFKHYDTMFFFDGRKNLNYSDSELNRLYIVSASFLDFGKYWPGQTAIPQDVADKISVFVKDMHSKNKKVRLWGTPNTILGYETLQSLGVDVLGTDDLPLLKNFISRSK